MTDKKSVIRILSQFGLDDREIAIYLECLKKDEHTPSTLAKATDIPRTSIYDILMSLSLKGLVELQQSDGFTKQQTLVRAKNPSVLREILREKRKNNRRLEVDVVNILPYLKGEFHQKDPNANFKFYKGYDGVRKAYFETYRYELDQPLLMWSNQMPMDMFGKKKLNDLLDEMSERRKNTKIKPREIFFLNDWSRHAFTYQAKRNPGFINNIDYRYIDNRNAPFNMEISIHGFVVFFISAVKEEAWAVKIISENLSKSLTSIFDVTWKNAKPVTKEIIDSWGENEFLKAERKKQ